MTPQELKNSILQLAIQGKLVEQRAEEGTAEELFVKIQEEKQKLIAEKKIKKEKPLPEITEEEKPFDIPESWKWVRFDEISNIIGTGLVRSNSEQFVSGQYYYFKMNNIGNFDGKCHFDNMFMINATDEEFEKYKLSQGDFLFNTRNSRELVGKVAVVPNICDKIILNNNILKIRFLADILPDYISAFFNSPLGRKQLHNFITNTTNVAAIYKKQLVTLLVPLPPLAEQKRIVAKIEELLPYIDRYEQAWSKLEQFNSRFPEDMKKSLLQYAIEGKLVEQRAEEGTAEEFFAKIQEEKQRLIAEKKIKKEKPLPEITEEEKPFDIPESWKWVRIASVVELNPKNSLGDLIDVSFIPMACIADGYKNQHTFEVRKWGEIKKGFTHFANNDIGIAKITPCFQNKKSVIFSNLQNGYGAGTTELSIVRVINDSISREYMLWFFKSAYFIENGKKSFTGTAGQQRIHKDYLANCLLPLPPLAEQKRIVEKLEQLLLLCERLK